jgi:hypothetical protein
MCRRYSTPSTIVSVRLLTRQHTFTRVFVEHEGVRVQLRHVLETDPYTRGVYEAAGATLKHWVSAGPSSHLWALDATAIADLDPSRARLTIVDEFDRCRLNGAKLC